MNMCSIRVSALMLMIALGIAACGGAANEQQEALVGKWGFEGVDDSFNRRDVEFNFKRDQSFSATFTVTPIGQAPDTGTRDVDTGTWTVEDNVLSLGRESQDDKAEERFRIIEVTATELTLMDESDNRSLQLRRR